MGMGLEYYCEQVREFEEERNRLLELYYSSNILNCFKRLFYKKKINLYDEILMHCYEFIGKQI